MTDDNKRLVIVSHGAAGGGSERVTTILANHFARNGYEVYFYAIHSDKVEYYLDEKVHYTYCDVKSSMGAFRQLKRAWKLKRYVSRVKPRALISFVYIEGIFLVGNHRMKKIYSLRNDPNKFFNAGVMKRLRNLIYRDADNIVFQTPDARDYFDGSIRKKGVLISNPVKSGLPYWNKENHKKEIIAAGRLNEQKNFRLLLKAFAQFAKLKPEYILTICGEGELREELEDYAAQLGVRGKVNMPGFCGDIHTKLSEAEIYVSSSDYEGISNSMIEALAVGIPSVCTDCPVGGAAMFIRDGASGFLVPVGNAEVLSQKLIILSEDRELRNKFSELSQQIRGELTVENICSEWNKLL